MASPGTSSFCGGMGYLFCIAMVTSMLWYMFWMVLEPVQEDISPIVNWYFFTKLSLRREIDFYGGLKAIHYWLPLLVLVGFILSKVSIIYRNYLVHLSQLTYVIVVGYNLSLVVFLGYSGWKVIELFMVTLPLYLLFHCGPLLSHCFSPSTLWIPTTFCFLLYYCFCCRGHAPSADQRPHHKSYGLRDLTPSGTIKRAVATFGIPLGLALTSFLVLERGCLPCSSTPGFADGAIPPKPLLVAHRGCSFDYPENSLLACRHAVQLPAMAGLETDVFVSMDGVLFLQHDLHLARTTDICDKCPSHNPYANSTLLYYRNGSCPLSKLNVATSFVQQRKVSPDELSAFQSEHIPTLRQFLEIAVKHGKSVIFDVNEPPVGHPHHRDYLNLTIAEIVASGISQNKVWWNPIKRRLWVHEKYPQFVLTSKVEDVSVEVEKINDDWGIPLATFREYQRRNLSINMFFVESSFMFSYAWCMGIPTVTTSNCKYLSRMNSNLFLPICRSWHAGLVLSRPMSIVGLSILGLQFVLFICFEVFKFKR